MQAIMVFALIVLVAYKTAINADHVHNYGPARHVGTHGEVIHWTTGTQTKGAAVLNETKGANTTDNPAITIEPVVALLAGKNSTFALESLLTAEAKVTEGHTAAATAPTVEPEPTTTSADPSKKH